MAREWRKEKARSMTGLLSILFRFIAPSQHIIHLFSFVFGIGVPCVELTLLALAASWSLSEIVLSIVCANQP